LLSARCRPSTSVIGVIRQESHEYRINGHVLVSPPAKG
jgi:hypothetical protein